ncbi:hypothetical protein [Chamaesiphon sp. OTE_20_metabat_361]|nr:hypothetical protein [Chamaesiphon sp. OTE_20_metabat_361]
MSKTVCGQCPPYWLVALDRLVDKDMLVLVNLSYQFNLHDSNY